RDGRVHRSCAFAAQQERSETESGKARGQSCSRQRGLVRPGVTGHVAAGRGTVVVIRKFLLPDFETSLVSMPAPHVRGGSIERRTPLKEVLVKRSANIAHATQCRIR